MVLGNKKFTENAGHLIKSVDSATGIQAQHNYVQCNCAAWNRKEVKNTVSIGKIHVHFLYLFLASSYFLGQKRCFPFLNTTICKENYC